MTASIVGKDQVVRYCPSRALFGEEYDIPVAGLVEPSF
jgi:hypothetical protein